jgi:excisionase family DNA binding protein
MLNYRRDEILWLREQGVTLKAIGEKFGISKERVRQIIGPKKKRSQPKTMLTIGEAALALGMHPNTLRRWANRGVIQTYRLGNRGDRRFKRADLTRLLKASR